MKLVRDGVSVTDAARLFGVSRKTAHKWLNRATTAGEAHGLEDGSRARHHQERFEGEAVELLTRLRRKHPCWGARKLLDVLRLRHPAVVLPAASTATDILKRAGLVQPRARLPRFGAVHLVGDTTPSQPNDRWTADFKGQFRMRNGKLCYPLTLRDATSRMVLAIRGFTSTQSEAVIAAFEQAFTEFGMPSEVHSDTGAPFGSTGLARLSAFSVFLLKHGVRPVFSRPGKPQDNGAHERMHRDLKAETTRPPGFDFAEQQLKFEDFRRSFNEVRPHEALHGATPLSQWRPSSRGFVKAPAEPEYPGHFERRRVDVGGAMYWHDREVHVTKALHGETVGLEPVADGLWHVYFASMCIGVLDERRKKLRVLGLNRPPAEAAASVVHSASTGFQSPPNPLNSLHTHVVAEAAAQGATDDDDY